MIELLDWHKLLLNDKSKMIKVLSGRRTHKTTLTVELAKRTLNTLIVFQYCDIYDKRHQINKVLDEDPDVVIKVANNKSLCFELKRATHQIVLMKYYNIQNFYQEFNSYGNDFFNRVIFDDIEANNEITDFILSHYSNPENEPQIYSFFGPYDTEFKWYVVPSINSTCWDKITEEEMREVLSKEAFNQEFMCGLVLPETEKPKNYWKEPIAIIEEQDPELYEILKAIVKNRAYDRLSSVTERMYNNFLKGYGQVSFDNGVYKIELWGSVATDIIEVSL